VYAAVLIAAITIALSFFVYSQIHYSVTQESVYSFRTYSVFGNPSLLYIEINSSSPSPLSELRVDQASSLSGILALEGSSYGTISSLCGPGTTTFFSVSTTSGLLKVSADGPAWIDGSEETASPVDAGIHEVIIADASSCTVTLPDGGVVSFNSSAVTSVAEVASSSSSVSRLILIPYETNGHSLTAVFSGAIETVAF
jgi:hypothetical protein